MSTKLSIVLSVTLALLMSLGGCITINPPVPPTPETVQPQQPQSEPALGLPSEPSVTAPELVSPNNAATGVELRPKFVWKAVPGAKSYGLRVSRHSDFSDQVISVDMGDTVYQEPPDLRYLPTTEREELDPSTQYYWMVYAALNPADPNGPVAYSEVWKFTTAALGVLKSTPLSEPTIDDVFLSRWGHTYYNNAPRVSYDLDQIEKLLIEIVCQVPWESQYKAGVFDCSEKSAYLEYVFERHGYTAEITQGEGHAWVLVYNDVASCWLPIESTLPVGTLTPHHPYTPTIGGIVECSFTLQWRYEDIHHVKVISEYDWWNSPYADQLVEASDRANLQ